MTEDIWKGTPAWVVPPVGFVSRGPCGVTYYPGTGLGARYDGHFFLCDFPGGIHSFAVKPKGEPSSSRVVMTVTPVAKWPITRRSSFLSIGTKAS